MMAEKYLLDANAFIEPSRFYYSFKLAPGFWRQMADAVLDDNVSVLDVVYDEIMAGKDDLASWLKGLAGLQQVTTKDPLILGHYGEIQDYISTCGIYKTHVWGAWGDPRLADPWLIAVAMKQEATIITFEMSKLNTISKGQLANKIKIPDVAAHFNVQCKDLYYFMREMGIRWE